MTESHTYVAPHVDACDASSGHAVGYAFLGSKELSLFHRLIDDHQSLPVCRAGRWVCYECPFESTDLAAVARHIVRVHETIPMSTEDRDED